MNHEDRCNEVEGEPVIPEFFTISMISKLPDWVRPFSAKLVNTFTRHKRLAMLMGLPLIKDKVVLL